MRGKEEKTRLEPESRRAGAEGTRRQTLVMENNTTVRAAQAYSESCVILQRSRLHIAQLYYASIDNLQHYNNR